MVESAPLDPAFFESPEGRRALTDVVVQLTGSGTLRSGDTPPSRSPGPSPAPSSAAATRTANRASG
jgi:hypothetical protein